MSAVIPLKTPESAAIRYVGTIEMTASQWHATENNPRQRDTESHGRRADHLRRPHPAHSKVNAARLPDGHLLKLDGHTRDWLWAAGKLAPPPILFVDIWECPSRDAACELYVTFDSSDAVETVTDKLFGGVRESGLEFQSEVLKSFRYVAALRIGYELLFGQTAARSTQVYTLLEFWTPQLMVIDECGGTRKLFHTGILAAALLCAYRYGTDAVPFWTAYAKRQGNKVGDEMDAVQALELRMLERRRVGVLNGRANSLKVITYSLSAFERFKRGDLYLASGSGVKAMQQAALAQWTDAAKRANGA